MTLVESNDEGLGSRAMLDKVDKLRELGVSATIPLPQIVAAGEQSAGKSSLLESLTGISFPRSVSLCTRFATEIICRRESETSIVISIQPGRGCSRAHAEAVLAFRRTVDSFTGDAFAAVFKEAAVAMGIKTDATSNSKAPTFTSDVLRIEKNGPDEEHLTLIDVPGIFENETPGLTTQGDIALVKEMVKLYIEDSRTIILAVVPCNTDVATQTIIRFASEVDPKGQRTLGVLTKPDLAVETATKNAVADLVRGRRQDLKLGYCIVRNRGADDHSATLDTVARDAKEREFFSQQLWSTLDPTRVGIPALRSRLRTLLVDRTRTEFPNVKREMDRKLKDAKQLLDGMGDARSTHGEQITFLCKIVSEYGRRVEYGRNAYYSGDPIFTEREDLRLITRIRELNEKFAEMFFNIAHRIEFEVAEDLAATPEENSEEAEDVKEFFSLSRKMKLNGGRFPVGSDSDEQSELDSLSASRDERGALYPLSFQIPTVGESDLQGDILSDPFCCERPLAKPLLQEIESMYHEFRGYELGTFGNSVIPAMFKMQAEKWKPVALAHVSNAILIVHDFISTMVEKACPDPLVREPLWSLLLEELIPCYRRAMDHARFLLKVELDGPSVTCNPSFYASLEETSQARRVRAAEKYMVEVPKGVRGVEEGLYINKEDLAKCTDANNVSEVVLRIHDVTKSYYQVVRDRFVDNICAHVVDHFLLSDEDGPLKVFSSEFVTKKMTAEDLDTVAGEDAVARNQRISLEQQIDLLKKAVKILRS
ncbi:dynamin family protein [Cercophora newfieldiana]|uniref:Dynamin family protein n=1 Tax=Cercophora newfieldiana TaxID=92897 RepID=A0AA40CP18_9PEZI|nr:dynamin family protein [Cercophora newfieldiana]